MEPQEPIKAARRRACLLCILFAGFLFLGTILFWVLPDKSFSETENRSLRTLPRMSAERFFSGAFSEDMNAYFADQFPMRTALVSLKASCELLRGAGENNGILLGEDGQLAKRLFEIRCADGRTVTDMDLFDRAHVAAAAQNLAQLSETSPIPLTILLPPRTADVAADAFSYPDAFSQALSETLRETLGESASYLDLLPAMREGQAAGEVLYYKTDHHWTTRGAYLAYTAILQRMGMEGQIIPEDAFEKRTVTEDFKGTYLSSAGFSGVASDRMEVWCLGDEEDYTVTADGEVLDGFYNFDYLEHRDCYSLFLDGTHDVVTIRKKDGVSRPTLLILKDSFANALAPFLARHFDLVLCNLSSTRRDFTDLASLAEQYGADRALIVYYLGNVIQTDCMNRLHFGDALQ